MSSRFTKTVTLPINIHIEFTSHGNSRYYERLGDENNIRKFFINTLPMIYSKYLQGYITRSSAQGRFRLICGDPESAADNSLVAIGGLVQSISATEIKLKILTMFIIRDNSKYFNYINRGADVQYTQFIKTDDNFIVPCIYVDPIVTHSTTSGLPYIMDIDAPLLFNIECTPSSQYIDDEMRHWPNVIQDGKSSINIISKGFVYVLDWLLEPGKMGLSIIQMKNIAFTILEPSAFILSRFEFKDFISEKHTIYFSADRLFNTKTDIDNDDYIESPHHLGVITSANTANGLECERRLNIKNKTGMNMTAYDIAKQAKINENENINIIDLSSSDIIQDVKYAIDSKTEHKYSERDYYDENGIHIAVPIVAQDDITEYTLIYHDYLKNVKAWYDSDDMGRRSPTYYDITWYSKPDVLTAIDKNKNIAVLTNINIFVNEMRSYYEQI